MATESFHRHVRRCVDAATSRVFAQIHHRPYRREEFSRLLWVAHARSDLMDTRPSASGDVLQLDVIRGIAHGAHAWSSDPETWAGARGHPLLVVHALASHLFGPYRVPRFLASAWFGKATPTALARRRWFIACARGKRFRDLPGVPVAMTRRMEHFFLGTPDHLSIDHALRRAEILGLGGSPALGDALQAPRLGRSFDDAAYWRTAIEWFVRVEDDLDLAQCGPIVDYMFARRGHLPPLRFGVARMMRDVAAWHVELGRRNAPSWQRVKLTWPRSRWRELLIAARRDEGVEWRLVEINDSDTLTAEGRAMRHCVSSYATRCARGFSTIWSLRRHALDDEPASVLTIEVEPRSATIVQLKGPANAGAANRPLEVVRQWAERERLTFAAHVEQQLSDAKR